MENAKQNPANAPEKAVPARARIPMSLPTGKLAVPEIPGYHLHWMRGTAQRLQQAIAGGYEYVEHDEVNLATVGLADGPGVHGSTDLGSRVSLVSGSSSEEGQAERLYLMKIKQEWWEADQKGLADRNEQIAAALRGDRGFEQAGADNSNRYTPRGGNRNNLFVPKNRSS